jgi:hypothetical protein
VTLAGFEVAITVFEQYKAALVYFLFIYFEVDEAILLCTEGNSFITNYTLWFIYELNSLI